MVTKFLKIVAQILVTSGAFLKKSQPIFVKIAVATFGKNKASIIISSGHTGPRHQLCHCNGQVGI